MLASNTMTKTLEQAAKELKESIDRLHKARMEFLKTYHWCSRRFNPEEEYLDKFDYQMRQDWTQR
jgi:hypothetical protein